MRKPTTFLTEIKKRYYKNWKEILKRLEQNKLLVGLGEQKKSTFLQQVRPITTEITRLKIRTYEKFLLVNLKLFTMTEFMRNIISN